MWSLLWHCHPLMTPILVPCDLWQRHADKIHSCSASHQWSTAIGQACLPLCLSNRTSKWWVREPYICWTPFLNLSSGSCNYSCQQRRLMRPREREKERAMGIEHCITQASVSVFPLLQMHPTIGSVLTYTNTLPLLLATFWKLIK